MKRLSVSIENKNTHLVFFFLTPGVSDAFLAFESDFLVADSPARRQRILRRESSFGVIFVPCGCMHKCDLLVQEEQSISIYKRDKNVTDPR